MAQARRSHQARPASKRPGASKSRVDRRRLLALVAVIVVAAVVAGVLLSNGSKNSSAISKTPPPRNAFTSFSADTCPLTDTRAPNGAVPNRPALAIKIGNEPEGARPQSGLNEADIVYDTPAEGGVMRYIAVFQCQDASAIGPTRSVRWVDWHIVQQFGHPILAYAGGIIPDVNAVVASKWLESADLLGNASSATYRTTNRVAPDNLYTSTKALYALFPTATGAPRPVFQYSGATPPGASQLASVQINFSFDTDGVWKWNGSVWQHFYANGSTLSPDIDALTNQQVTTNNVVIQVVHYTFGPYEESPGSTGDVESNTVGSGTGYVLRNGTMTKVTWHRSALNEPDTFTNSSGDAVKLAPGRTWVEMVIDTTASRPGAITFTP